MSLARKESRAEHSERSIQHLAEIIGLSAMEAKKKVNEAIDGLNRSGEINDSDPKLHIFNVFRGHNGEVQVSRLLKYLRTFGIRETDHRLSNMLQRIREFQEGEDDCRDVVLNREQFYSCINNSVALITQCIRSQLVIPNWAEFTSKIKDIFHEVMGQSAGKVASYIPQLARVDPNIWGISVCTISGQRFSIGDSRVNFCFQSISKAFNYAILASDVGADVVHSYVGHEPSGRLFNEICLDANNKPHNPMINAGAIVVTSLLKLGLSMADRFDFVLNEYKKLAGEEHIGFNTATFLSERDTADRNYALSYYLKENKCFPPGIQGLREELDFYFQLCSLETNCETAALMAATLANGGVCPTTGVTCIKSRPCRDVLSLMYSCGMYDFSGNFAFDVGLPAKSGVSGAMIVVVPNLMGICLYSPPLDHTGNSCKGVEFCRKLIDNFNLHNYDSLLHSECGKCNPRRKNMTMQNERLVTMMFAAKENDLCMMQRLYYDGTNMDSVDYDNRTALHIAASEGHKDIVKFLHYKANCNLTPKDRYGRTPYDDALLFNHPEVAEFLLTKIRKNAKVNQKEEKDGADDEHVKQAEKAVEEEETSGDEDIEFMVDNEEKSNGEQVRKEMTGEKTAVYKAFPFALPSVLSTHIEDDSSVPTSPSTPSY